MARFTQARGELDFPFLTRIVWLFSAIITLAYLRPLARRVPNSFAARLCGYLLLGPLLPLLKVMPIYGIFFMAYLLPWLRYLPWLYLPVTAGLFLWFSFAFKKASRSASQSWASETAPADQIAA